MAEDAQTQDLSTQTSQPEGLPERLRVHSLARVLGTTSRRVLDVLAEFDGRQRSAHSTVAKADAERVREALERIERLYIAWKRPEQAAEYRTRLDRLNASTTVAAN